MTALDVQVQEALARLGEDEVARERIILTCLEIEERSTVMIGEDEVGSVRDLVTGPIVDALHTNVAIIRKALSTGEVFEFAYRSKVAREFVMSVPRVPDHVWEPQTTKALVLLAEQARTVVIGGAYFGDHAILVGERVAANGGRVHAFEPNPEQAATLRRNVELNPTTAVDVHPEGLWSHAGAVLRLVGDDAHAYPEEVEAGAEAGIATTTIDVFAHEAGIDQVDVIMLDIEGGEGEALAGASDHLSRPADQAPIVVFEIHRSYVDWDAAGLEATPVVSMLTAQGYTLFAIRDYQGNVDVAGAPIELVPIDDIYLAGPPHGFNLLAVKDEADLARLGDWRLCPGVSPKLLQHKDPALHAPLTRVESR